MAGITDYLPGFSLLDSLLNYKNPANAAFPYLDQAENNLPQYFQPYINAGNSALPALQGQYASLLSNPGQVMSQIGSGYQQSPGFQFALQQALNGANNAAAAGGMLGTPQHQQQAAGIATNLANQDYYNYLNNALGLYGSGLSGLEGLYQGGMGASMGLGEDISNILGGKAQLAYQGQNAANQHNEGILGAIIGGLAGGFGF